ncbi:UBQ5 [Auxenochlorella protothecoides x Auxenochlorella symbiontica]
MQLFLRGLEGRTTVLTLPSSSTSDELYTRACLEGAPDVSLLHCSRTVEPGELPLCSLGISHGSSLHIVGRLRGGKGGFGSNLRAAGKAKMTDNYDACRDLQGRRIRQQTAAKKLEEWQAQAGERELEVIALRHLKQLAKEEKASQKAEVDVATVRQDLRQSLLNVSAGVAAALAAGKRVGSTGGAQPGKRGRIDPLTALSDGSDSEDEEGQPAGEGRSASPRTAVDGPEPGSRPAAAGADAREQAGEEGREQMANGDGGEARGSDGAASAGSAPEHAARAVPPTEAPAEEEPALDLGAFASATELQALGLDRLKRELAARGLKGGGSLAQRADRLFLLKSMTLEEVPRSHLAKP